MRIKYLLILLLSLVTIKSEAQEIEKILSQLKNSKGTTVLFTHQDEQYILTMQGDQYRLNSPMLKLLFDGENLYTYNNSTNELTIEKLTGKTVLSNPTNLFNLESKNYKISRSGYIYTLLPKNSDELSIDRIKITIDSSGSISNINVTPQNSDVVDFKIDQILLDSQFSRDEFKFNKREFQDAEIIDFR